MTQHHESAYGARDSNLSDEDAWDQHNWGHDDGYFDAGEALTVGETPLTPSQEEAINALGVNMKTKRDHALEIGLKFGSSMNMINKIAQTQFNLEIESLDD